MVEPDGRLVGLITTETIGELMMVSQAMPQGFRWFGGSLKRSLEPVRPRPERLT